MSNNNKIKGEDFIFSWDQLRLIADTQTRTPEGTITRRFINGQEFTSKIASGTKSNFEDAEIVAESVFGADGNSEYQITYEVEDAYTVKKMAEDKLPSSEDDDEWLSEDEEEILNHPGI